MLSRGSALLSRIAGSVGVGSSTSSQETLRAICTSVASLRMLHEPLAPTRPPGSKFSTTSVYSVVYPYINTNCPEISAYLSSNLI